MEYLPLQYITDSKGKQIAVVLPIEFWEKIFPQDETDYLASSKEMKKRILEAMQRTDGISYKDVCEKLGI